MDNFPYLIALALTEQGNSRAMPIGGKSLKQSRERNDQKLSNIEQEIALELLIRLLERSEKDSIKGLGKGSSLLLIEIALDAMQSKLPLLKSEWIKEGNTEKFITSLKNISEGVWTINFVRYQGMKVRGI